MLVIKKHRKLLLNLRDPDRLLAVMPTAKSMVVKGQTLVAVPHREDEVRVLRNLGFDPPAPISTYYDWAGQYTPFVHQRATAEFFTTNPRSFCLNGMGSGKTMSVLWAFDYLRKAGAVKRMLVISPLSTLERAWGDEIFRNFFDMTFCVLHGSREKRHKLLALDFDIYIINHDGITAPDTLRLLREREGLDVICVDEIASFRNSGTDRWKSLNALVNPKYPVVGPDGKTKQVVRPKTWVWGLTGTPTPNTPTDAWAQCRIINPSRVAPYFTGFRDQVMIPITKFKWKPRDGALDTVKSAMQPAIRFSREECIDLPPTTFVTRQVELTTDQQRAYNSMLRTLKAEHEGGAITAMNEAIKVSKLVQICCLRGDTPVLTSDGWITLERVSPNVLVWDGVEWVAQRGAAHMGVRQTVDCGGVEMTEDHLVLSSSGWITAKEMNDGHESGEFDWAPVWIPDRIAQGGKDSAGVRSVGMRMRVWCPGSAHQPISSKPGEEHAEALRMPSREPKARPIADSAVQHLGSHAGSLSEADEPGLPPVWGEGYTGLRAVVALVRGLLGGCGGWLQTALKPGQDQQRRRLRTRQRAVGDTDTAGAEQARKGAGPTPCAVEENGNSTVNAVRPKTPETSAVPVFDLVNCGPRRRFVVRSKDGTPRIVHNCGVAYGKDGVEVAIPAKPRIELVREIIEEAEGKVLVFVPLTAALEHLAAELRKEFTVEVVHGQTSAARRNEIFKDFQQSRDPRVIVANPGTLSHGLTLTAANTIIWFAPINSNETFQQANARIVRPGQKLNTLIANIEATDIERKMYARLQGKQTMQGLLLDLLKDVK